MRKRENQFDEDPGTIESVEDDFWYPLYQGLQARKTSQDLAAALDREESQIKEAIIILEKAYGESYVGSNIPSKPYPPIIPLPPPPPRRKT